MASVASNDVKVKDFAVYDPSTMISLEDLLRSYGALALPGSHESKASTSPSHFPLPSDALEDTALFPIAPSFAGPSTVTRDNQSKYGLITPPTSDDGAATGKRAVAEAVGGEEGPVQCGATDPRDEVTAVEGVGAVVKEGRAQETASGLLDFSEVWDYLANTRAAYLVASEKLLETKTAAHDAPVDTRASEVAEVELSVPVTVIGDANEGVSAEFRELGAHARTAYYANSPFLRATRDTSVRRPRGHILPSALDIEITPLKRLLPLEAYYTPPKPRLISSIERLAATLPEAFPADAEHLVKYADDPEQALGDRFGVVEWTDGIGRMVRDDSRPNTVGYTGGVGSDKKGGVHLFLDHSNIFLSYLATLAETRPEGVPAHARKTLSILVLTMLMARGRPIKAGRMHLVGSYPLMQDLDPAVRLGWRCSVLKRVPVDPEEELAQAEAKAKRYNKGTGATSESEPGGTTDSDVFSRKFKLPAVQVRKNREQGVDEMLQLKIMQTIVKNSYGTHHQGTIVLATGDGHGGQYNLDGFVGCVRDALRHGWAVELWAWNSGLSRAWEREKLTQEGNFVLWNLDHWLGDLIELK